MRKLIIVILLIIASPALGQPVTILFRIGSQLDTEFEGISEGQIETRNGPYYFRDVSQLTFTKTLPDTALVRDLQAGGITVYLKYKKVKSLLPPRPAAPITRSGDVPGQTPSSMALPGEESEATVHAGIGIGLDYGGIGMRFTMFSSSTVSAFGGVGYNLGDVGFNGGLDFNFTPHERTTGFLCAMYGYNGVIVVLNGSGKQSTTYYGPSFGLGLKSRSRVGRGYFSAQLIYPVRDEAFYKVPVVEKPWPVLFSIGYNF